MKLRFLLIGVVVLFVVGVLTTSSYAKIDPKTIDGMWLFDESSGTTARDSSGNGNDGTLMNGPKWVDGKFGKALEFDGVDDYVNFGNSSSLDILHTITYELWVKPFAAPNCCTHLIGRHEWVPGPNNWYGNSWIPLGGGNGLRWGFTIALNPGASDDWATTELTLNEWNHIAATFDDTSNEVKLYLNGVLINTLTETNDLTSSNQNVISGYNNCPAAPNYFNGLIDEVAIFKGVLEERDIQTAMNQGLDNITAVYPTGKLAATWATIKAR